MRRESFLPLRHAAFRGRSDAPVAAAMARPAGEKGVALRAFGVDRADEWLGGGLRGDGLHEFHAADSQDLPSALSFALLLASRLTLGEAGRGILWLRRASSVVVPYGPGLVDLGIDPAIITILSLADAKALLRAGLDAVRAGAVDAVLLEMTGRQPLLDLTATRRLVLAAAETGTFVPIVRAEGEQGLSAAHSRWRVGSAPSRALAANAPGMPVFDLTLLRHRGGREGLHIQLEWNRDTASFREGAERGPAGIAPPLSGGASALAAGPERADPQDRAA